MIELLKEYIKLIVAEFTAPPAINARVLSVDQEKGTCKVQPDDGPEYNRVRLVAVEDNLSTRIVVLPKVGSYVLIAPIDNIPGRYYVSKCSDIEEVIITSPKVTINGGDLGGLAKARTIKEEYDKTKAVIDALIQACQTPVNEPGNGSPSAFQAALKVAFTGKSTGSFNDIENNKVLHG